MIILFVVECYIHFILSFLWITGEGTVCTVLVWYYLLASRGCIRGPLSYSPYLIIYPYSTGHNISLLCTSFLLAILSIDTFMTHIKPFICLILLNLFIIFVLGYQLTCISFFPQVVRGKRGCDECYQISLLLYLDNLVDIFY